MRTVTERDFRLPEFADADPKDYEFRADGKLVRKDRWEKGIVRICSIVGLNVRNFEIEDVIQQVEAFVAAAPPVPLESVEEKVEALTDLLNEIGWRNSGDAQHRLITEALPKIKGILS